MVGPTELNLEKTLGNMAYLVGSNLTILVKHSGPKQDLQVQACV